MTRSATRSCDASGDENLHQLFYRDLAAAAIELAPDEMMGAIERQVHRFEMPGAGIPGFAEHARRIARAGIYDLTVHHEQILMPVVVRQWRVEEITGLSAEGEQARERLMARLDRSARVAERLRSSGGSAGDLAAGSAAG